MTDPDKRITQADLFFGQPGDIKVPLLDCMKDENLLPEAGDRN